MARNTPIDLVLSGSLWSRLRAHLFPGDGDEHGAIIAAGVSRTDQGVRLLARDLFLAEDGVDYMPGQRGYRMLTADFVRDRALYCREEKLAYLAIHNHGGHDRVAFSADDLRSHERGYPAIQDLTRGQIVGGLVFAERAVAGDLWIDGSRESLRRARILGGSFTELRPAPLPSFKSDSAYDRQARLFGDRGQALLSAQRVGVVGLGGVGSWVSECLARMGVGELILVDPDRLELSNVSRVVNSARRDALAALTAAERPKWLRERGARWARKKVSVAAAAARRANPKVQIETFDANVADAEPALALAKCDYLFLAADTMQARLVFNAIVHQYLVPGVQLGAKVPVNPHGGEVGRVFSVVRPVLPDSGCLWCNGLILPDRLADEALTPEERRAQRYVDEPEIVAPSVITLNAVAASHGVNDYLFRTTGLRDDGAAAEYIFVEPRTQHVRYEVPRRDPGCIECGAVSASRLARGDHAQLPVRTAATQRTKRNLRARSADVK